MLKPNEILGVPEDATSEDARAAYKRLAQQHHPDKGGDVAKFQQLRAALKAFERSRPCPLCKNTGLVKHRVGLGVTTEKCPRCWAPARS